MGTAAIEYSAVQAAAELLRRMDATQVFLFGSATKGGLLTNADVDMAVAGLPAHLYFSPVSKASDILSRPVDLVDLDDPAPLVRYLRDSGDLVRVA